MILHLKARVADPHRLNVNPKPAFHLHVDTDPPFNADPDPARHESHANLQPLIYRLSMAQFFLSLHVSLLTV
jgi:hypothetical protein